MTKQFYREVKGYWKESTYALHLMTSILRTACSSACSCFPGTHEEQRALRNRKQHIGILKIKCSLTILVVLAGKSAFSTQWIAWTSDFPFVSQIRWGGKSGQVNRFLGTIVLTLFMFNVFSVTQLKDSFSNSKQVSSNYWLVGTIENNVVSDFRDFWSHSTTVAVW